MQYTKKIEEARKASDAANKAVEEYAAKIDGLDDDTKEDERAFHLETLKELEAAAERALEKLEREVTFQKMRENTLRAVDSTIKVGEEPKTYRQDVRHSYFKDLLTVHAPNLGWDNPGAAERLQQHGKEVVTDIQSKPELRNRKEFRDVTSADPGTGTFIPPLYLGSQWIDEEVAGRPFADALPSIPLPSVGKQLDFPRVQTAPAAAVQASEAAAVNEVDFDGETYSVSKVLIAGQNDLSIQAYEFADPGMDVVIMRELNKSYNSVLDSQLIAGSGSAGQHRGLRNVSSINTVTFSSGNGAALLGKIYDAISQIATNAPGYVPNAVLMHPRRAAWIASHRDANGSLLQQGSFFMSPGEQDGGFAYSLAGLRVIQDANIVTNLGASTNEDEMYVMDLGELYLAEGPLRARVLSEVLSGTLQVRLQLFAFSAAALGRRPKVITKISGAGLATPTFPST